MTRSLIVLAVLGLSSLVYSQDPPPQMDSVTVNWDQEAQTGHTATVRWSEQLPEPSGIKVNRYRVWRSLSQNDGFKLRSGVAKGVTVFIDKTVISGKTYYFYITAVATNGTESGASSTVAVTIP